MKVFPITISASLSIKSGISIFGFGEVLNETTS